MDNQKAYFGAGHYVGLSKNDKEGQMNYQRIVFCLLFSAGTMFLPYKVTFKPDDNVPIQEKPLNVKVDVQCIDDIIIKLTDKERHELKKDILEGRESALYRELSKCFTIDTEDCGVSIPTTTSLRGTATVNLNVVEDR